ncbi:cupin domain-containing protein [Kribbella sp. NBC_01245]|uniref:JmjC domain-containing protein n=1 Tax=Kribbella sp. NBC_01245 TaxID=2903578 RepID=UPI002E2AF3C0|nr:cupin domain-containing protein [Kribbella sp. NBC_01245]
MRSEALSSLIPDPSAFLAQPPAEATVWRQAASLAFGLAEAGELLDHGSLQRQMVSLVKDAKRVAPTSYTWAGQPIQPGFSDVARSTKISAYIAEGATTVLESLHRTWKPIGDLCRRLSFETGLPISANAYLTPSGSQGFAHHYDTHSVLIVQTAGSKTWQLHTPVYDDPLEHQPWNAAKVSQDEWERLRNATPFLEVTLKPGDSLWIPRGWIHNGFATDDHSLHVSFSFPTLTPYWIANELVRRLGSERAFRTELPWGFGQSAEVRAEALETTAKLLAEHFVAFDPVVGEELADDYRRFSLESARRPMDNFLPAPTASTPVRTVAESAVGTSWTDEGSLRVHLGDSVVLFEADVAPAVAALIEADSPSPWTAADLGLPSGAALELVTTLLRTGMAVRV